MSKIRITDAVAILILFLLVPTLLLGVPVLAKNEWVQHFVPMLTLLAFFIYIFLNKNTLWMFDPPFWSSYAFGAKVLLIALPIVYIFSESLSWILENIFNAPRTEQLAVALLKSVQENFPLFLFTIFNIVIIVPLIEEILFRGFIQSCLRNVFSPFYAILITSIFFAMCHVAPSQGLHNISIALSLFILSCFLGYVFEKKHRIWASYALHMLFNAVSIVLIFISEY